MFDGDNGVGETEFQPPIIYLINEMDSRTDGLNKLKDIVNDVKLLSKADPGRNEEEMANFRHFVDYFIQEFVDRMHDLCCVNAAHYNSGILYFVSFFCF